MRKRKRFCLAQIVAFDQPGVRGRNLTVSVYIREALHKAVQKRSR